MELSGNLSDFALADILQILALSKKSGTLSLESGGLEGRMLLEEGKIISVTTAENGETKDFKTYLVDMGLIDAFDLNRVEKLEIETGRVWPFEELLIESGLIDAYKFSRLQRQYLRDAIVRLLMLQKGRFGITLSQRSFDGNTIEGFDLRGLDIGEALLEAAILKDEITRGRVQEDKSTSDNFTSAVSSGFSMEKGMRVGLYLPHHGRQENIGQNKRVKSNNFQFNSERFDSLMAELKSYCFETEISLLMLRCASEIASRGVLFVVQGEWLIGFGQFGFSGIINQRRADQIVRDIRIPLSSGGVIADVARIGKPYCGISGESTWDEEIRKVKDLIVSKSGDRHYKKPAIAFAVALMCGRNSRFVIYGEQDLLNGERTNQLPGFEEFLLLINQAGLLLKKLTSRSEY